MAKIGSSQPPTPAPGGRRIGGAGSAPGAGEPAAGRPAVVVGTLAQRLESATLAGPLPAVPAAYDDGPDWETVLSDDVFARLYLDAALYAQITDAQVAANQRVLTDFWTAKKRLLITGNRDLEDRYRPGTVGKAEAQLAAAAAALADAGSRAQCFAVLDQQRREAAGRAFGSYLRPLLHSPILNNKVFLVALQAAETSGFTPAEAEGYLLAQLRQAGYAPVKTINPSPNLLLAEWTPGGAPLIDRPSAKVLGHDVYSLAEAGQVLYAGFMLNNDRVNRDLLSGNFLAGIANDLKERSLAQDLLELMLDHRLTADQKRLSALYLLNPGLPLPTAKGGPEFANPQELLRRAAASAADFAAAEALFKTGLLPIWIRAAAPAEVKAALPVPTTASALDFRRFLHQAAPATPLWMGEDFFTGPAQLAAYIRRDEHTWKAVYGSLSAGYLAPWLRARGQAAILDRQAQLAGALLGPDAAPTWAPDVPPDPRLFGSAPTSEQGRLLAVQALLEALDPQTAVPALRADLGAVDLTGLSGETPATRTLTLTNETGGPVRVFLALEPPLAGVRLSASELFFDRRAPGQQQAVTLTGNPALMPRDGQHAARLAVRTAYAAGAVPVRAEAVFPVRQFLLFVGGAGLALAVVLGGVRYLLGLLLGQAAYADQVARGELLPLRQATELSPHSGLILVGMLLLLAGLLYGFGRGLMRLARPRPVA